MNPLITLENSRFEAMKLKNEPVQSKNAAENYLVNNTIDSTKLTEVELKEKKRFLLLH